MRVMVIVKANEDSERGRMPTEQELAEMGKFNEELAKSGIMLAGEGLHPSSRGRRVQFSSNGQTVAAGPFEATNELIAGYWVWRVASMDEAVQWVKRAPFQPGAVIELRPIFEAEDFGQEFTAELREQEERVRAEMERQS